MTTHAEIGKLLWKRQCSSVNAPGQCDDPRRTNCWVSCSAAGAPVTSPSRHRLCHRPEQLSINLRRWHVIGPAYLRSSSSCVYSSTGYSVAWSGLDEQWCLFRYMRQFWRWRMVEVLTSFLSIETVYLQSLSGFPCFPGFKLSFFQAHDLHNFL